MTDESDEGQRAFSAKELYRTYAKAVIPVFTIDQKGDEHTGSAFHVGEGVFVTARHVVEGQAASRVAVPGDRFARTRLAEIDALWDPHRDTDVAVFSMPQLADLPAILLGGHLDDWINHQFILNEVLVLGYPPVPLAREPVLIATRAQINAVIDLINVKYGHFIISAMARGGFSGGTVLSEWGVAMGVVTSSLLKNGAPEELGYLTVLGVEPIYECLAAHGLLTRDMVELWDGLFTAVTEHFGVPDKRWAHSEITTDRDGHRARLRFSTPDVDAAAEINAKLTGLGQWLEVDESGEKAWHFQGAYSVSEKAVEVAKALMSASLLDRGYARVEQPAVMTHSLEEPTDKLAFIASLNEPSPGSEGFGSTP